jgi:nicotinamide riboside kinase
MQPPLKKIVIIGPESTGKSTLCTQLARYYQTQWCPEFAREYLLKNGTNYSFDDLLTIAKGQLALEDSYIRRVVCGDWQVGNESEASFQSPFFLNSLLTIHQSLLPTNPQSLIPNPYSPLPTPHLLFLDTDMYVMKVWCEFVFGDCHPFILNQIVDRQYDLYLLCKPDLPWVKDELREYPDLENREKLYNIYKDLLINQQTPWAEISGGYNDRLTKAITAVEGIL